MKASIITIVGIIPIAQPFFVELDVAELIDARMAYLKEDLATAANHVVNKTLVDAGESSGIISVDKYGNVAMSHNTPGIYRGYAKPSDRGVFIYGE